MTPETLEAIRQRHEAAQRVRGKTRPTRASLTDIPALLDEVSALRAEVERLRTLIGEASEVLGDVFDQDEFPELARNRAWWDRVRAWLARVADPKEPKA